jgi:hypothetical protein
VPFIREPELPQQAPDVAMVNRTFCNMGTQMYYLHHLFQHRGIHGIRDSLTSSIVRAAVSEQTFFHANINGKIRLYFQVEEGEDLLIINISDIKLANRAYSRSRAASENWALAEVMVGIIDGLTLRVNKQPRRFKQVKFTVEDVKNRAMALMLSDLGFRLPGREVSVTHEEVMRLYWAAPFFVWPRKFENYLDVSPENEN